MLENRALPCQDSDHAGPPGPATTHHRPRAAPDGRFYTYTSEPNGGSPTFATTLPPGMAASHQNVVAEWRAVEPGNPAAGVDLGSRRELLRIDWPQFNNNGGDITFGPDGKLFIPTGDGGGSDDLDGDLSLGSPIVGHSGDGNAQKLSVPLGKILRIDVDGTDSGNGQYGGPNDNPFVSTPGAVNEIWAYGLRNPAHISFDTATGGLVAGDVGQNDLEEVDVIVKRSRLISFPGGPDNYGRILHVAERARTAGRLATIKEFRGFADKAAELGLTDPAQPPHAFRQTLSVLGMGQDATGELYILGNGTGLPFGTRGVVLGLTGPSHPR